MIAAYEPPAEATKIKLSTRWFPMRITHNRTVHSALSSTDLPSAVMSWAKEHGFRELESGEGKIRLKRGRLRNAFYSFDVRKLPTTLSLHYTAAPSGGCEVNLHLDCNSWPSMATPADKHRLSHDLLVLENRLMGMD